MAHSWCCNIVRRRIPKFYYRINNQPFSSSSSHAREALAILQAPFGCTVAHIDEWTGLEAFSDPKRLVSQEIKSRKVFLERTENLRSTFSSEISDVIRKFNTVTSHKELDHDELDKDEFKLEIGPNGFTEFIQYRQNEKRVLLDAEEVARQFGTPPQNGGIPNLFASVTSAKLDSSCGRFVLFVADVEGREEGVLGVRDLKIKQFWDWDIRGVSEVEILKVDEDSESLVLAILGRNMRIQNSMNNSRQTDISGEGLRIIRVNVNGIIESKHVELPENITFLSRFPTSLQMSRSKSQDLIFISRISQIEDEPIFSLWTFRVGSSEPSLTLLFRHKGKGELFCEMWRDHLLLFERRMESFRTIESVPINDVPIILTIDASLNSVPIWSSDNFYISDVDVVDRGIVLYGTTEVGKPELRILIPQGATGTWHPYHVEFDSAGVIKMTDNMEMQTSCEDRSLTPEKHQPVNSLKYPALFPTVRNPDSHTSNQPFYGCLIPNPDSVYFSNSLNFKLSSFLIPEISYSIRLPNRSDDSPPTITATRRVDQTILATDHEGPSRPTYSVFRLQCPAQSGDVFIPVTLVRPVFMSNSSSTKSHFESIRNPQDLISNSTQPFSESLSIAPSLDSNSLLSSSSQNVSEFSKKLRDPPLAVSCLSPDRWEDDENDEDPPAKCLVLIYGSSGTDPYMGFQEHLVPLLARNWVIAVAHVRGGPPHSLGPTEDTTKSNKSNSVLDARDVFNFLIAEGITSRCRLSLYTGSAGGLLAAQLLNTCDGLISSAVLEAPFLHLAATMMRPELLLSPLELKEWGNPRRLKIAKELQQDDEICENGLDDSLGILSLCPYFNLPHFTVNSPWLLLSTAMDDVRTPYWHTFKWLCRRRIRGMDLNNRSLLRIKDEGQGGHSDSLDMEPKLNWQSEVLAFLEVTVE